MNIREIFRNIESHDLAADLNLALNLSSFFRIAKEQESVQNLKYFIRDMNNISIILLRINALIEEKVDLRYENPYDAAITIYTWALLSEHRQAGKIAAEYATSLRQGWWAIKYARNILNTANQSISTGQTDVKPEAVSTIEVDEAGEVLIYLTPSANLIYGIQWYIGSTQGAIISNNPSPLRTKPEIGFQFGSLNMQQWFPVMEDAEQRLNYDYYPTRALSGQMKTSLKEFN